MSTLRISNATRTSILCTHANIATTPQMRRQGLIGMEASEFQPGAGLFFPECNAIHTLEMSLTIDVLFFDMLKQRVHKAAHNVEPGCYVNCLVPAEICAVLELPAGVISQTGTRPGDAIVLLSSGHEPLERAFALRPGN